ncbi:SigE family RNA polymerase sigma factor [Streptomyces sp. R302]|uniref:SigE family RNA polymerase sigma factor n=1 Tax=unclassified Streptomyces TaxID=2593676 RepID=UPI00145E1B08|nr:MULTISPECIES: SigE family RNA polymerase sigma factor [unclassified Streptomyces]NML50095.1 SigE family RNA polymerase sigma factor [Streptomyces sp. R301]NML79086.1 SigE family RNA polymerase sigma factor [Streptomyces sp. R302]
MRDADVAAFTAFVEARSAALFRTALLLTGDRHLADDLVQSTLEKVCRNWRRVRAADSSEAYARRILVNLAHDRWRGRRGPSEVPLDDGIGGGSAAPYVDPYKELDVRDELMRTLHTLPAGMRTVLVLRYFEDLDDAEIGALLDVSPSSVRSQAARGLAKLRSAAGRRSSGARSGGAA